MQALCAHYQTTGFVHASFSIAYYLPQGEHHALLRLAWQITQSIQGAPQQFATDYNLINTAQGWRIVLCTAFEEQFT